MLLVEAGFKEKSLQATGILVRDARGIVPLDRPASPWEVTHRFELQSNFPNPFHSRTTIPFVINQEGPVTLAVYTMLGEHVETLLEDALPQGTYSVAWDPTGKRLASGTYLLRIVSEGVYQTRPLIYIK